MPAGLLSLPFILLSAVWLYLAWEVDGAYATYLIPNVIILALLYTFSPQINWWWYRRYPPEPPKVLWPLLERFAFYSTLSPEEKQRFRQRVALFNMSQEFMPQGVEAVPDDLKLVIGGCAVQLTFYQEDFLFPKFENIVLYPKPFPTPQYPTQFHTSEIYEEDGVVLLSAEPLMRALMEPRQYYQIGLHEYAKVFRLKYPDLDWPDLPADTWELLQGVSGFSKEAIHKYINLEEVELFPVSVSLFFTFPDRFRELLPGLYESYAGIFGWTKSVS
ncbi:MAG: zinc-dependent peptidase [Saprospiraceae bacterium]|jgi:hypothetical protein|nr:zinc-dependent peptidase [Saprospiraceae bacterium]